VLKDELESTMVSASTAQEAGGKEHFMAPFPSCQAGGLQSDGD